MSHFFVHKAVHGKATNQPFAGGLFDGPAELPRVYVDTTFPSGNWGTQLLVGSGRTYTTPQQAVDYIVANLDDGLDHMVLIDVESYLTQTTLKAKTTEGKIVLATAGIDSLTEGHRVFPADNDHMPKLTYGADRIIDTQDLAHHYRLVGLEITPTSGVYLGDLARFGHGDETSESQLVHHMIVDRCYLHGDPVQGGNKGLGVHGNHLAVIDSYISDLKSTSSGDTNAIWGAAGGGPIKIVNDYIEGAGENVMFGGATVYITGLLPSDLEIRRNHFKKPLTWYINDPSYGGVHYQTKNWLEFKFGRRALVEANVFENHWADAQTGFGILSTPRSEGSTVPWATVCDVTMRYNIMHNCGAGFTLSAADDNIYYQIPAARFSIHDDLLYDVDYRMSSDYPPTGADGRLWQFGAYQTFALDSVNLVHLTLIGVPSYLSAFGYLVQGGTNPKVATNFAWRDCIMSNGTYGLAPAPYDKTVLSNLTSYSASNHAIIGGSSGNWPGMTGFVFPADIAAVKFVDDANHDYRITDPTSPCYHAASDGLNMGADIDEINTLTAHSIDGNWP